MADVIKQRNVIQVVAAFTDGDDRTISLDVDPNLTLTNAQIAESINGAAAYAREHNILLGDKAGADFTGFKTAKKIVGTIRYLDLT